MSQIVIKKSTRHDYEAPKLALHRYDGQDIVIFKTIDERGLITEAFEWTRQDLVAAITLLSTALVDWPEPYRLEQDELLARVLRGERAEPWTNKP